MGEEAKEIIFQKELVGYQKKGFNLLNDVVKKAIPRYSRLEITCMEYNHPILTEMHLTDIYILSAPKYQVSELKAKLRHNTSEKSRYQFMQYKNSKDLYLFIVGNGSRFGRIDMLVRFY